MSDSHRPSSPSQSSSIFTAALGAVLGPFAILIFTAVVSSSRKVKAARPEANQLSEDRAVPEDDSCVNIPPTVSRVPFFYAPSCDASTEPPFPDLLRSLDKYRSDTAAFLSSMTRMHEVSRRSEWVLYGDKGDSPDHPLLAANLRDKIGWTAECLEHDYDILEGLMTPFPVTKGLPAGIEDGIDNPHDIAELHSTFSQSERRYTSIPGRRNNYEENTSYDSAAQVVTHIVRDWSISGRSIRQQLYDWCVSMVLKHGQCNNTMPILVPGSGLGRLAYDIYCAGYSVEANDISISMAAVAYQILNGSAKRGMLHPFCFDFLVNEANSGKRYDSITFPDIAVEINSRRRGFSYTLGDFVQTYGSSNHRGHYGAVISCFFIDTATNIYEYLAVIHHALSSNGIWINVGPVQWHQNALVQPSGDELRLLIEGFGFKILHWSIDTKPLNYRHDDDCNSRYTKAEAYLPIRFVVRKQISNKYALKDTETAIKELRKATMPLGSTSNAAHSGSTKRTFQREEGTHNSFPAANTNHMDDGGFVFVEENSGSDIVIEELS